MFSALTEILKCVVFQSSLKASHYSVFEVIKNPSYDVSGILLLFCVSYKSAGCAAVETLGFCYVPLSVTGWRFISVVTC